MLKLLKQNFNRNDRIYIVIKAIQRRHLELWNSLIKKGDPVYLYAQCVLLKLHTKSCKWEGIKMLLILYRLD